MNIRCISFDEEQNVMTFEMDDEAKQFLLEYAINDLLKKSLAALEDEYGKEVSGLQSN